MVKGFSFDDITFQKDSLEDFLVVSGDITNKSSRDYSSVVFRMVVCVKEVPVGHTNITINGFKNGTLRHFEKRLENVVYSRIAKQAINYEVYFESGY